jgi:hypothetical protein
MTEEEMKRAALKGGPGKMRTNHAAAGDVVQLNKR